MGLWNFWMSLHLCGRESIGRKFRVRNLGPAEDGQKWSDHQFRNYGIDIEIRVAALTCIGQREFSKIVDKKSAVVLSVWLDIPSVLLPQTGLKVKSVTSETVELEWIKPPDWQLYFGLWFLVDYRKKRRDSFDGIITKNYFMVKSENPRILHGLKTETTYCITISTVIPLTDQKRVRSVILLNLPLPKRSVLQKYLLGRK